MTEPGELTHRDLAEMLRQQMRDGTLPPGARLPSEAQLVRTHGTGRELVRRAMRALRAEGLIEFVQGEGFRVPLPQQVKTLRLPRGSHGSWRMPTQQERREFGIREGVPVLVVTYGGKTVLYPGDRWEFTSA